MYYTMDKPLRKLAAAEVTAAYGLPSGAECGGTVAAGFDMQCGAEAMTQMLSAVGSGAALLCGVGSCYNANGLSAENIVIGMALKRAADFLSRGMRLDTLEDGMESMRCQQDAGHYLMDDLTLDMMRSDEFFADPLLNLMGEFRSAPSMLQRAQEQIREITGRFVSPVPVRIQKKSALILNSRFIRVLNRRSSKKISKKIKFTTNRPRAAGYNDGKVRVSGTAGRMHAKTF